MILKSNGKYVENIAIEYNSGASVSMIIKLTDIKHLAYKFDPDEYEKIKGLTALEVEGAADGK